MSDSVRPHRRQPTRLPCPWDFPGNCHVLLQCMKVKSESEVAQSCPTQRPHGLKPTRLLHPWDFSGKSTGVGCHFLLQCMIVKSESEVTQLCPTQRPHGLQPTRLLHPWDFPGKSTQAKLIHGVICQDSGYSPYTWLVGLLIGTVTVKNSMQVSQETKCRTTIWPSNQTWGYISEQNQTTNS